MFVGHLAAGLIGKRIEPRVSLGTWVVAVMLSDLLLFPLLLAKLESVVAQPNVSANRVLGLEIGYSHSLLTNIIWASLFGFGYYLLRRYRRGAVLLFAGVLSHWVLDVLSHRPDMPLAPGVPVKLGFGIWNSLAVTLIVEGGLWLIAIVLYVRATSPKGRAGVYVFWSGIVLLTLIWHGNITRGMDPDPIKAGIGGLILFSLIVAWAYLMNRLRPAQV